MQQSGFPRDRQQHQHPTHDYDSFEDDLYGSPPRLDNNLRGPQYQRRSHEYSYGEDLHPLQLEMMNDIRREESLHIEERVYRTMDPAPPSMHRQYGIGRGPPPVRSTSFNPGTLPSTAIPTPLTGRRSRSTQLPAVHDAPVQTSSVQMADIEALFQRVSLQQEERHREQMAQVSRQQEEHHREQMEQNQALHARMDSLERRSQPPVSVQRGGFSGRARNNSPEPRDLPVADDGPGTAGEEVRIVDDGVEADDESDEEGGEGKRKRKKKKVKTDEGKTQTAIQTLSTKLFRGACGVKGRDWPDPDTIRINPSTGVRYLSPVFPEDVNHPRNHAICVAVAAIVGEELKSKKPAGIPQTAKWTDDLLFKCAQNSFRACKESWKKGEKEENAKRAEINERSNRWYRRRCTKMLHIKSQLDAYAEKHGLPAHVMQHLLTEQLLSDEASGPEDEDESFDAWKVRMATAYGLTVLTPAALKKEQFLEVLKCPWRSDELSEISHELQALYDASLKTTASGNPKYKRVITPTQRTWDRIPYVAPWDFGISAEWLDAQRRDPASAPLVHDWGKYGDPEGFGAQAMSADSTTSDTRLRAVDPQFDFDGLSEREE
ncbi:hypothetical protein MSAN_00153400 [Mycena sanguinolenta]|uniref:Uncharacterized protein n=1 Tax=Mycena sanguinolenta TaxID=230812 RepID=A0A8H6ZI51_9AGAR|nr:hypothetical protein MSAN_00153400 [Mycena sanguinolenta]